MPPGDTARLYHRFTSYSYVPEEEWPTSAGPAPVDDPRVLQDFVPFDLERLPAPCKAYPPGLRVLELPRGWPPVETAATAVLAGQPVAAPAVLDLPGLARLLHLSAGVVRVAERGVRGLGRRGTNEPLGVGVLRTQRHDPLIVCPSMAPGSERLEQHDRLGPRHSVTVVRMDAGERLGLERGETDDGL